MIGDDIEKEIREYPFLNYIKEDKSKYKHAKDCGYIDPDDLFLIGESGGFLLNIEYGDKFINTELFSPMANAYRENGNQYTKFRTDSIPHRQLRKREEHRRKYGFSQPCLRKANGEIRNVRITGSHYNFLNYTMMERLDEKSIKIGADGRMKAEKTYDFSTFIDAQFWTFHIMEFAINNGFHLIIDKTRRGGFSYIMAADTANDINLYSKKVCIHVADDKKYLTKTGGLTDFTINNLKFYEHKTPFVRGIISMDKENFKLGFKLPSGVESPSSWSSALFSVSSGNNPDCAIGKDALKVKVEEVSTMENFDEFMTVTEPAMRTGSYHTGTLMCWGTATSGNMQTFARNFYNPKSFGFMPFENVWDKDSRHEVCGYFKPYVWGLQGEFDGQKSMDKDGNSNIEIAMYVAHREREDKKKNSDSFAKYINYLGQYANYPCESFSSTTENIFTSEELLEWEEKLSTDNSYKFYTDGMLYEDHSNVTFKPNAIIAAQGGKYNKDYYDWIYGVPRKEHENPHGCIRKWFNPIITLYTDKNGQQIKGTPPGMYCISYDPVGINKKKEELTLKHSHNSIKVWEKACSYNNYKPKLAAAYYGRPDSLAEADKICLNLAKYYNCIGNVIVEVNRGETVSNFSSWHATKYLFKDNLEIWDNSIKGSVATSYGISMSDGNMKLDALRLLKEMLYSVIGKDSLGNDVKFYQTIYDYQSILELKMWNNKGNFDRVSEMLLRAIVWKNDDIKANKEMEHRKKVNIRKDHDNIFSRDWF